MFTRSTCRLVVVLAFATLCGYANAGEPEDRLLKLSDVFELEHASDPQISPDGQAVVYVRNFMDIMTDRRRSNLWTIRFDGSKHRPLTSGMENDSSPRWSPDGTRLAYVSTADGSAQIYMRWMDTGQEAKITRLQHSPGELSWSPDGKWLAFSMFVPSSPEPFVKMPEKPEGATWAPDAKVIRRARYRADGAGYLEQGFTHLFIVSAEGGTPRQLTRGDFHHGGGYDWTPDGKAIIFSANRRADWEFEGRDSEVYEISVATGKLRQLTKRYGPDLDPKVSPDGAKVAYLGFDDKHLGAQTFQLYVMNRDGSDSRCVTEKFDRSLGSLTWRSDGRGVYAQFDKHGDTKLAYVSLDGKVTPLTGSVGGLSLGRPYEGGSYSIAPNGRFAFTHTTPDHPADVAVGSASEGETRRITKLNADVFDYRDLADVEELWFNSSFDQRRVQGWIVKPPGFDPSKRYPLILEIHGGPFANYGPRFAMEMQLYAASGYVVLYINPRGSTSYGHEFANLIHHAYPGNDYDDLMSGVDAVIEKGYVDQNRLFVTGGSGGGVLTSWIVGKTGRFAAAVVAKPVINWYSFALTSDIYPFVHRYWFSGLPWEVPGEYMRRSPLSLVGNVSTPTMLLSGEHDYRTPIGEAEQFFHALKLRGIETVMIRIPEASHGITKRPSNLIAKVAFILKWFERHQVKDHTDLGVKVSD